MGRKPLTKERMDDIKSAILSGTMNKSQIKKYCKCSAETLDRAYDELMIEGAVFPTSDDGEGSYEMLCILEWEKTVRPIRRYYGKARGKNAMDGGNS